MSFSLFRKKTENEIKCDSVKQDENAEAQLTMAYTDMLKEWAALESGYSSGLNMIQQRMGEIPARFQHQAQFEFVSLVIGKLAEHHYNFSKALTDTIQETTTLKNQHRDLFKSRLAEITFSHGLIMKLESECIEEEKKKLKYEAAIRSKYSSDPEELKEQLNVIRRKAIEYFSGRQAEYETYKSRIEDYRNKAANHFLDSCRVNRDLARGIFLQIVNMESNMTFDLNNLCLKPFDEEEPTYEDILEKIAVMPVKVLKFDLDVGAPTVDVSTDSSDQSTTNPDLLSGYFGEPDLLGSNHQTPTPKYQPNPQQGQFQDLLLL